MELIKQRLNTPTPLADPTDVDSELVAALIDGRLSASDADALRNQLANTDAATLTAIAEAMAMSAEFEMETSTPPSHEETTVAMRYPKRRWPMAIGALAAAALLVVFVQSRNGTDAFKPYTYASAISVSGAGSDRPIWSISRGAANHIPEPARSIRVGVLLTNLALESIHQDSTGQNVPVLLSLLADIPGAASAATSVRALQSSPKITVDQLKQVGSEVIQIVDDNAADLGAYLQATRIAVEHNDTLFFSRTDSKVLTNAASLGLNVGQKANVAQLAALVNAKKRDWAAIGALANVVLLDITQ